jgi:membrane associated rhomboid family serine protease
MATCDVCGTHVDLPYNCRHCGGVHCAEHRLPENHGCPGLANWNDPSGVFGSGFDDSVDKQGGPTAGVRQRVSAQTSTGGFFGYFRGNVSYVFLAIMIIVYVLEFVVLGLFGFQTFTEIFTLSTEHPLYVWTWVTSVFSHSPATFFHLFGNAIVLFFFGPFLERRIGSRRFTALFLVSGIAAGLAQVGVGLLLGTPTFVLGASGAIMAVLAVITVLNPELKVYLYFVLPIPIWVLTLGYAALSVFGVLSQGAVLQNVAHAAHLVGLVIGFAYGQYLDGKVNTPSQLRIGGRMGGGRRRF